MVTGRVGRRGGAITSGWYYGTVTKTMKKLFDFVFALMIFVLVSITLILFGIEIHKRAVDFDGLSHWRTRSKNYICTVTYQGHKYYCEHAESPAGYLDRIILYRNNDYLVLPDKISIQKKQAK